MKIRESHTEDSMQLMQPSHSWKLWLGFELGGLNTW